MAGNNDEKIVSLHQLDRLTKSLDARNSTIIQNVHDELISAIEDVEKKLFSKDYNDLTNTPEIPSIEGLATEELVNNLNNDTVESINEINTELETKASTEFVNTMLGGLRLIQMTQSEYDALPEKDSSTLYIII